MPNYTKNQILAKGAREDLAALIEAVGSADAVFDFERLIPMPAILDRVIEAKTDYAEGQNRVQRFYMENPEGETAEEEKRRPLTEAEEAELAAMGHDNWKSWSRANWGTKWNAIEPYMHEEPDAVRYRFRTADNVPMPVLKKLFAMFPLLDLEWRWQDEEEFEIHIRERAARRKPWWRRFG